MWPCPLSYQFAGSRKALELSRVVVDQPGGMEGGRKGRGKEGRGGRERGREGVRKGGSEEGRE